MTDEIKTRADFAPEIHPEVHISASLPPEGKVTLQLALCVALALLDSLALAGAICGVVDKATLSNCLSVSLGGILGLLTGGSRIVR